MNRRWFITSLFGVLLLQPVTIQAEQQDKPQKGNAPKFELLDGDRVLFLGNTLIEREQKYGYWETMLTARYPDRNIIFRNLGWDGDTVWADSRGIFDPPAKGYQRMLEHVGRIKPTVIFLGYGNNEAFAGKKGLPAFIKQYNKLIDDLKKVSAKNVLFVILSPIRHEHLNLDPSLPDPSEVNRKLKIYTDELRKLATKRSNSFIDFFSALEPYFIPLTEEGIHFNDFGYRRSSRVIDNHLNLPSIYWNVSISSKGKIESVDGTKVTDVQVTNEGLRFKITDRYLPLHHANDRHPHFLRTFSATGLSSDLYSLHIDNTEQERAIAKQWSGLNWLWEGPEFEQAEKLRQAIVEKNLLYFYSWRPQNVTYLFLFRKHEQGQNAKEVEEFRKLVAEKEKEIARLKKPVTHTYELIRVKEMKN